MEEKALIFRDSFNEYAIPFDAAAAYMASLQVINKKGVAEVYGKEKLEADLWAFYQQNPEILILDIIKETRPEEWKDTIFYHGEIKVLHPFFSPIEVEFRSKKNWMLSFSFDKQQNKKFR